MDEDGHTSVVLHADLDCFYAAVEHVRLGIPTEVPLAVQQWEGCIAVNYAARAAGIVRHERVSEALRKCPELQLVHVETIGGDPAALGTAESLGPGGKAKASLERYRQASAKVLNIFRRYSKLCERASIDEAYLDVSEQVEEMLQKDSIDWEAEFHRLVEPAPGSEKGAMLIEGGSLAVYNAYDRRADCWLGPLLLIACELLFGMSLGTPSLWELHQTNFWRRLLLRRTNQIGKP